MKLGENSQVEEITYLQWYSTVQTFPSLSMIKASYLPKRHTKWCRCTSAWGCPDTAHNPGVYLLGRLDETFVSETSELQARYKKRKLCCCAEAENCYSPTKIHPASPSPHLTQNRDMTLFSLVLQLKSPAMQLYQPVTSCCKNLWHGSTLSKRYAMNFNFQFILDYMKLQKRL